ncbi:hypothetical protein DAPPUDRAFT_102847 [Daphnia pulex]|uniref:Uncharacterized protein n=1 Tax=Daphnia pulex TaxID=6669 RepID=E9GHQ9_DAPPU|nr:hypothetical protein DAPPUDRAFT_102847 [Daphnia pulex]|eukprot:EFX81011.1 hypothetical protein DAPPUDRAFT_102847 [Daphnia pulex]
MRPTDRAAAAVGADAAAGRLRCGAECFRRGGFRPPGCPFPWDLLLHHRRRPCDDGRAVGDAAAGGGDGGGGDVTEKMFLVQLLSRSSRSWFSISKEKRRGGPLFGRLSPDDGLKPQSHGWNDGSTSLDSLYTRGDFSYITGRRELFGLAPQ